MAYTRRQELFATQAEVNSLGYKVLLANEILYIKMNDGTIRAKLGDGVTTIAALPFVQVFDGSVAQAFGDSETLAMSQKTSTRIANSLFSNLTNKEWAEGGISASSASLGAETTSGGRIRSAFISLDKFSFVYIPNTLYAVTVFVYDEAKKALGTLGEYLQEVTKKEILEKYPQAKHIRFVMKKGNDLEISPSIDVSASQVYIGRYSDNIVSERTNDLRDALSIYPVEFTAGNIDATSGAEIGGGGTRCRSSKIEYNADINIMIDHGYVFFLYFYKEEEYIGKSTGWLANTVPLSNYTNPNGDGKTPDSFAIVVKNTEDQYGTALTPETIASMKKRVTLFTNDSAIVKLCCANRNEFTKYGLPVLELAGDTSKMTKDNAVTLNYKYGTRTGTCSCKWQGSSSVRLGYPKRNYTIKFKDVEGNDAPFEAKNGWGSQSKYCMKANWIDPSAARNIVNARLWGQVVASRTNKVSDGRASAPNYGAVDGFPIIITINGRFEGLYTFNIPKDAWMFAMGGSATEYLVCSESNSMSASLFKKLATFTGDDTNNTLDYSVEYVQEGVSDSVVINSFNQLIQRVIDAGEDWETSLSDVLDIDSVVDYFIFANCIGGHDNLGKNIIYGTYNGTKWFMSAYDLDSTYGSQEYGQSWYPVVNDRNQFADAAKMHRLAYLLYTYSKARLKARYKELREGVLSDEEGVLSDENVWYMLTNFVTQIPKSIYDTDSERWAATYTENENKQLVWMNMPATSTANISTYMDYYRMHCAHLDKEVDNWNV